MLQAQGRFRTLLVFQPFNNALNIVVSQNGEVFHKKTVNEDVATTNTMQENASGSVVEKVDVVSRYEAANDKHETQKPMCDKCLSTIDESNNRANEYGIK
jgi:hypothetical protein